MSSLSFLTSHCFFDANLRIIDKTADRRGHFFPLQATKSFAERKKPLIFAVLKARMAELVDALDSKSSARKGVRVRPPLRVLPLATLQSSLQGLFVFPLPTIFLPVHPEQFRQPTFSLHARTKAARIRYSYCPSSIRPDTKKPAAFSGRRLKSTVERSTITGNPDSQGSG